MCTETAQYEQSKPAARTSRFSAAHGFLLAGARIGCTPNSEWVMEVLDASVPDQPRPPARPAGRWTMDDLHVHTIESNDAQMALPRVLDEGLGKNHLDWVALSNHLRVSDRDHLGNPIAGGPIPMSRAIARFEAPWIAAMQAGGIYAGKTLFSAVEWDVPTHEHSHIGILTDVPQSAESFKALNEFEYLFTNRDVAMFDPADVARWGAQRAYTSHADALKAFAWLKERYPNTSYGSINHPHRYPDRYKVSDFREINDVAPNNVFMIEGMVGNQMEPDRGGYASPYIEANAHART